jgi:hypothetical protein
MMLKNIMISVLVVILLAAAGFSAYNVLASGQGTAVQSASVQGNAAGGQGQGRMGGQGQGQGAGQGSRQQNGSGTPAPQNGFTTWTTYQGTVSSYAAPNFTLTTSDGQQLAVQLGNLNYVTSLGLELKDGDSVTLTGFQDPSGSIAVGTITLDASGQSYTLRTENGRPAWAGGGNH